MATIITKNSSTASSVPAAGSLQQGELAVNVTDKKLYTKDSSAAVVKLVGSLGNQEANAVAITGGTINGTAIGGTTPAAAAFTTASASGGFTGNLTGNASTVTNGVYITGSYADPAWITSLAGSKITGNISGNAANVTGTVAIANGGTGLTALGTGVQTALGQTVTGSGGIVLAASPSLTTPNLGTPSAVTLTNATGLPVSTGISGLGTNVATALGVSVGSVGSVVVNGGALGTPSSGTLTNATGLPLSTGVTGTLAVANGGTGITAFGSGVATALGVNVGSAGAFVVNGGALGTPSSGTVTNLTGTASININGTVGATTPTTGAFTTLSASGNITVSGGTANGVAYLNGSKVLTTGSALVFDGSNLGIGVTPAAWSGVRGLDVGSGANIAVASNSGGAYLTLNSYYNGASWIYKTTAAASYYAQVGGEHLWYNAGSGTAGNAITFTQAMTLGTTGNLGIGTSSPTRTLTVYSASSIPAQFESSGTDSRISLITSTGSAGSGFIQASSGALLLGSSNAERMRITSAGDVGIGTTSPSAKLHVVGNQFRQNDATGSQGYVINTTSVTTRLETLFGGSSFAIRTGASASDRLFIDGSGNVGIGTSSPASKLDVAGAARLTADAASVSLYTSQGWRHTGASPLYIDANSSGAAGSFIIRNGSGFTTQLTLDSSGNLGLGVTPSAWASGWSVYQASRDAMFGGTNGGGVYGFMSVNAYADGSASPSLATWRYKLTGSLASRYDQNQGVHAWYTAPSGTAGNAISFTQALTLNTNGALVLQGGNTSASGVGVTFPATQSASSDANTLDDYEEGTFTPVIAGGITSPTYTVQNGTYTKIGRLVTYSIRLTLSAGTAAANLLQIGGLPFTAASAPRGMAGSIAYASGSVINSTSTNLPVFEASAGSSTLNFYKTNGSQFLGTDLATASTFDIDLGGQYFV